MTAWYNEIDPYAAQWLRNLIAAGHIAPGDVDERSIADVRPDDLRGYKQCHFFAGIGVWSYALRLAGWRDDRPVWTGSCPCQPFSAAGKGEADADARHLWPEWLRLIGECRPATIFGEQVDAAIRVGWLDDVFVSLESLGYSCGAVDFPACSVGAPHIRQRCYFVADSGSRASERNAGAILGAQAGISGARQQYGSGTDGHCDGRAVDALAHSDGRRFSERGERDGNSAQSELAAPYGNDADRCCVMGDADESRLSIRVRLAGNDGTSPSQAAGQAAIERGATNGFWRAAIWLPCRDGKARAVKPGIEPLVNGTPARVGRLRAYGNCIVAPQAAEFIQAYMSLT